MYAKTRHEKLHFFQYSIMRQVRTTNEYGVCCHAMFYKDSSQHNYPCIGYAQCHNDVWPQVVEVPRISRQSAHEGSKVVSITHRPSLPQEISLLLIYVTAWVDPRAIMQSGKIKSIKIPKNFQPVAQCLNQLRATAWPRIWYGHNYS